MSNQQQKSFKQIIINEGVLISLFVLVVAFASTLAKLILLVDINVFRNLTIVQQLKAMLGAYDYTLTDVSGLQFFGMIFVIVITPFLAAIMAHRLNGERVSEAISNGFGEVKSMRFWNFNFKVYFPCLVVVGIYIIVLMIIPDSIYLAAIKSFASSLSLAIFILVLLVIFSILVSTFVGLLFITNVAYLRGANHIRDVLEFIPRREISKLLIFNVIEFVVALILVLVFIISLMSMMALTFILNVLSLLMIFIVIVTFYQLCFLYLRFSLYMSISSKIVPQDSRTKSNKSKVAAPQSKMISTGVTEAQIESTAYELSIKPKSNRRKNRFVENSKIVNKKPKRSIK